MVKPTLALSPTSLDSTRVSASIPSMDTSFVPVALVQGSFGKSAFAMDQYFAFVGSP